MKHNYFGECIVSLALNWEAHCSQILPVVSPMNRVIITPQFKTMYKAIQPIMLSISSLTSPHIHTLDRPSHETIVSASFLSGNLSSYIMTYQNEKLLHKLKILQSRFSPSEITIFSLCYW
jgi:hypothetical protein